MSIFRLPSWVIKEIDRIGRDFLWKSPKLGSKGLHLVTWQRICKLRNMGGWEILNLHEFNTALLGKWWWKLFSGKQGCWSKILHANYIPRGSLGPLFLPSSRKKFLFWAGISSILHPFRLCSSRSIKDGHSTFLWHDKYNWFEGRAPKDI